MVSGKNAVSGSVDLINVGTKNAANASKSKKNGSDDFKSMLDKNAQSVQNTQGTQNDTAKTEAAGKESAQPSESEAAVPKKEETGNEENGMELAAMAQFIVLPEQERAALNWAEAPEEAVAVEGVESLAAGALEAGAQEQTGEQATFSEEDAGLLNGQDLKAAADGGEQAAKAVEKQDSGQERQAEPVREVRIEAVKDTEADDGNVGVEQQHVSAEARPEGKEEEKPVQDAAPFAPVQKEAPEESLVNIKVGDTVQLSSPKAVEDMADTIFVRALERNNEFEMQLNPEELGTVKIKLVFEDGKINIAMTCDNQKAADLLSATSSRLRELIEDRTGSEVNVQVEQESETPYHEQERESGREQSREDTHRGHDRNGGDASDFIQQLRLGLVGTE